MTGVLAWAAAELEHVGRIVAVEDKDIQYAYALSTVNGMMHLKKALFELAHDKNYSWKKEELLRTHGQVVRALDHLIQDFNINLGSIKAFNTRHIFRNSNYPRATRKNKRRGSSRKNRRRNEMA